MEDINQLALDQNSLSGRQPPERDENCPFAAAMTTDRLADEEPIGDTDVFDSHPIQLFQVIFLLT